jgi:tetratricopeptide (TPR) repeat protein
MSEEKEIEKTRKLITENNFDEASKILWKLYQSKNSKIKLDSILALLVVLDRSTENETLLAIADVGINLFSKDSSNGTKVYLMTEKCSFLLTKLGFMSYRQANLKLSASIFKWINFSTEREKKEFEIINQKKSSIELELQHLEEVILNHLEIDDDHYSRGNIYMRLGDCYNQKLSNTQLDAMVGGKTRSKIGNIYFIRRWRLDKWVVYNSKGRKEIRNLWQKCVQNFERAISEFESGSNYVELAHAYYNLAVKYKFAFQFIKAKKCLKKSSELAKEYNESQLLSKIELLNQMIANKNQDVRNYVEEYGLDMP